MGIANLCWNKTVVNSTKEKCLNSLVDAQKNDTMTLRACSHEPGTVKYPGASVTSRSHDDLLSQGNVVALGSTSLPRGKYNVI